MRIARVAIGCARGTLSSMHLRFLAFTLALPLSALACSSSNFSVAGSDDSAVDDSGQSGGDASIDSGTPSDTSILPDVLPETSPSLDAIGEVIGGDATSTCPGTTCSGACVDTNTDPRNCGGCGKAVCHNGMCQGGKARCVPGFTACGAGDCDTCVDLGGDARNCGSCGKTCDADFICASGKCVLSTTLDCPAATTMCAPPAGVGGSSCFDLKTNSANCGACGRQCQPDEYCNSGACTKYGSAPGCTTCPCSAFPCRDGTSCCTVYGQIACADGC